LEFPQTKARAKDEIRQLQQLGKAIATSLESALDAPLPCEIVRLLRLLELKEKEKAEKAINSRSCGVVRTRSIDKMK
jgi:hypothetical protein